MRRILILLFSITLVACGSSSRRDPTPPPAEPGFSATTSVTVELRGNQEVPAVNSEQQASAMVEVDNELMLIRASLNASDVAGFTAAHIHEGTIGTNGGIVFPFVQGAPDFGASGANYMIAETAITQPQLDTLLAGGWYINVHTDAYPDGELRGQILTDNFTLFTFSLTGDQEVPAVDTEARGDGYALVNTDTLDLDLVVITSGVDDATAAHIHTGTVGENGGVLVGLEQDDMEAGTWRVPDGTMLGQMDSDDLLAGGLYVNVHTPAFPEGEIRGQILTDDFILFTFPLSGDQEVPAVDTEARGDGYAVVNTGTRAIDLVVHTSGVDDATAAHIHVGNVGENGGVLVGLEQDAMEPGVWMTPSGTVLEQEDFEVLLNGGHYVNVHTPAFGDGEIRGQIQ
jgi:hypothetical protein